MNPQIRTLPEHPFDCAGLPALPAWLQSAAVIERILRRLSITASHGNRLSAPTPTEQQLIDELRRDLAALTIDDRETTEAWANHRRALCDLAESTDPRTFLRWKPIMETMFFDQSLFVRILFARLKKNWKRWGPVLKEDRIGSPMPYYRHRSSSANLITHAFHLAMFEEVTGAFIENMGSILEFGGGYGSMCRLIRRLGFSGQYTIHDLPEFLALQRYFLGSIGLDATFAPKIADIDIPIRPSCFIATWSLSETPLDLRESLLPLLTSFDYFLIGYQEDFEGIDNVAYFEHLQREIPRQWKEWRIDHLPNWNRYLIGFPR